MEKPRGWRWGVNRWLILLFIVLGVLAARAYPPIMPHVQLPAEELTGPILTLPVIGPFSITNTFIALAMVDLLLLLLAIAVRREVKKGNLVLTGLPGVIGAALEALYELTESTAGKWAKRIFPWVATIVLLVLLANWMELIPAVDSVGKIHPAEEGHPIQTLAAIGGLPLVTLVKGGARAAPEGQLFSIVPFVRVVSTDLNFTLALALISVFMTQVYGVRALGAGYFTKFFNAKSLFSKPFFGAMDFGVGLLELVSEVSKIISFSFRLFGNIFAGSVLLFVIGAMVPVFAQTFVLLLEFFVGLIQALIFGMLTMVFMAQATAGHGTEESH